MICFLLQVVACIAMNPAYHDSLNEVDMPDPLMQLLLPSDAWYHNNHTTK